MIRLLEWGGGGAGGGEAGGGAEDFWVIIGFSG